MQKVFIVITRNRIKILILLLGDLLLLYGALIFALYIRYWGVDDWNFNDLTKKHFLPFSLIFLIWLIVFGSFELYDPKFLKNSKRFLFRLIRAAVINIVIAIIILYLIPIFEIEPRRNLFIIAALSTASIFIWRSLFNLAIIKTRSSRVIFFGINKETIAVVDFLLMHPQLGQKPVAFISNGEGLMPDLLPLPNFSLDNKNLGHIVKDTGAETIVISKEIKENKALVKILFQIIPMGIGVVEFSSYHEAITGKIPLSLIGEVWFLENLIGTKKRFYEFFKRALDFSVAAIIIVPSTLLLPLIAALIKLDSEGPVFFKQKRVGRHGKIFFLVKYRTMVKDADRIGGFKGEGQDPRQTKFGRLLRKSYLDELPQIINIFRGEMSFIGPRPERPEYVDELKQKIPFYEMRLIVPPGITGWAQINMENDASVEDAPEKMQYDLYYIKNRSPMLDLLIILRTAFTILRREGR